MLQKQKEGIAVAKAAGKNKGRKKVYTEENEALQLAVELYKKGEKTVKQITAATKVRRSSLYTYIKAHDIQRDKVTV